MSLLTGTYGGQDAGLGVGGVVGTIGAALYYDMTWVHASLPPPRPTAWLDHSIGFMLPVSTRF